jgi:hypothetical protein
MRSGSTKHQYPSTKEAPITKFQEAIVVALVIGIWSFSGYWSLGFGAF